jgi:DNA-binding SARP family transcriptional activator
LFGLLTIEEDEQPAAVMKSPKGYALLVHLLITKKTHSREVLADLLWEARSTQESLRNLRQLLSRVKKWLPELDIDRSRIGLQPDLEIPVDLYQFETQISSRQLDQRAAALRLYDGELLSGFYLNDALWGRFNSSGAISRNCSELRR